MTPTKKKPARLAGDAQSVKDLQRQLAQAEEAKQRALADYQNLIRRNQEDRLRFVKMANKELVADLLEPLEHLGLAATQLNDSGLNMVVDQLWQRLNDLGLEEIKVMGQPFDVEVMEAVEKQDQVDNLVVTQVRRKGYLYQGEVVQHAQVVMGPSK